MLQVLLPGWPCDQMHSATCRTLFNIDSQLCLDAGNITEVCSNAVVLVSCVNTASQRWTAYTDRSVRPDSNASMCLDVAGNLYTQSQAAIHTWWACMPCSRLQTLRRLPGNSSNLALLASPFCMHMHMGVHAGCQALVHWRWTATLDVAGRLCTEMQLACGHGQQSVPGCMAHPRQEL